LPLKPSLLVFAVCSLIAAAAAPTTTLSLPNSQVNAVKTDAMGKFCIAGFQGTQATAHAFVAKLSPTGNILWSTTFAGSNIEVSPVFHRIAWWPIAVACGGPLRCIFLPDSGILSFDRSKGKRTGYAKT
jgi:hypothetical protein